MDIKDIPGLLKEANTLIEGGDLSGGINSLDRVLALDPKNKDALLVKGKALVGLDRTAEAVRYLEYAAAHNQDDASVWDTLANAALKLGQGAKALVALINYQRLCGSSAATLVRMAAAAYLDLQLDTAKNYIELALLDDPQNEAAGEWRQKLSKLKNQQQLLIDVGRAHCRSGRFEDGTKLFNQALIIGDCFDVRLYLGRAALVMQKIDEAIAHLKAAVKFRPKNVEALGDLATALYSSAQRQEAEPVYDKILSIDPDNVNALLGKASFLALRAEFQSAQVSFVEKALKADARRADAWRLKAHLVEKQGNLYEARVCTDHAISLQPDAAANWIAGLVILKAGNETALANQYLGVANRLNNTQKSMPAIDPRELIKKADVEATELKVFLDGHPGYSFACMDRCTVYEALGLPERALQFIDAVLQKTPNMEDERLQCKRGAIQLNLGKIDAARASFTRALELNPGSDAAKQGLDFATNLEETVKAKHLELIESGKKKYEEKRFAEGVELFTRALQLIDSYHSRIFLGQSLMALNRYAEALPHLEIALMLEPDNQEARADLEEIRNRHFQLVEKGMMQYRLAKFKQALDLLKEALELGESFAALHYTGKAFAAINQHEPAIYYLRSALKMRAGDPEVAIDLASAFLASGQIEEAEQLYNAVQEADPANVDAMLGKGRISLRVGKIDAAGGYFAQAINKAPARQAPWLMMAQLLEQKGSLAEARLVVDHAIALNPGAPAPWILAAAMLQKDTDKALADRYLRKVKQLEPSFGSADGNPVKTSLMEISRETAILDAFIVKHNQFLFAYRDRAVIYKAIGENERAQYYRKNYLDKAAITATPRPAESAPAKEEKTPPPKPAVQASGKTPDAATSKIKEPLADADSAGISDIACKYCGMKNSAGLQTCKYCGASYAT